ncbi:hypothetical protein PYW08_006242 [Mythimna loreyi]|uniref:Uncharacterized protein n=1 Tax=Mythimna loreyi TaxID=667449 RepID=A0ACC2QM37_9NEOP|nr:hypothetical protein PYW08_006242 [Mythimna loreyi]
MANATGSTTSKMLKCANCNVVICEVLAFIQNKCDVMDEDSMIRLCATAFTPDEISAAKNLLFASVKIVGKKINRKREGKMQREIEDIIALIKQKDPEEMPIFVARDLQKLPPVTFDHLDATRILKDLILLKHEIETIKETYTPMDQFSKIRNELINLQQASIVNNFERDNFVNRKRGTSRMLDSSELNCESGPSGMIHITPKKMSDNNYSIIINKEVDQRHKVLCDQRTQAQHPLSPSRSRAPPSGDHLSVARSLDVARAAVLPEKTQGASFAAVTNAATENNQLIRTPQPHSAIHTQQSDDDVWQVVQRKRHRNRFLSKKGTCTEIVDSFRAANISVPLFINNVHMETCEKDIIDYIKCKTNVEVTLQKIDSKQQKQYNSYKMYVPKEKLSLFLDCSLWPDGIAFRRFVDFNRRDLDRRKKSDTSAILNING